jgi:hypothetical protein
MFSAAIAVLPSLHDWPSNCVTWNPKKDHPEMRACPSIFKSPFSTGDGVFARRGSGYCSCQTGGPTDIYLPVPASIRHNDCSARWRGIGSPRVPAAPLVLPTRENRGPLGRNFDLLAFVAFGAMCIASVAIVDGPGASAGQAPISASGYRSTILTVQSGLMFFFISNRLGCLPSLGISLGVTLFVLWFLGFLG